MSRTERQRYIAKVAMDLAVGDLKALSGLVISNPAMAAGELAENTITETEAMYLGECIAGLAIALSLCSVENDADALLDWINNRIDP